MQPKVTVLVAVYNAERYLPQCLDSLCAQTLADIQIICIDDCSQDRSMGILRDYAARDSRIHIVQTPRNSGQAVARNMGLDIAEGEYITMLDSDDWYVPQSLEQAYAAATQQPDIDCALFRLILHHDETGVEEDYKLKTDARILSGSDAFRLSLDWGLHGLYLVRATIHKRYPYDTSCRLYSDDNTTRIHYLHSRKVVITDAPYYYRKHAQSTTSAISPQRFLFMDAELSMKRQIEHEGRSGSITDIDSVLKAFETKRWLTVVGCWCLYRYHQSDFTDGEKAEIRQRFALILKTIERRRVSPRIRFKIGYFPFRSLRMFILEETIYFRLREIIYSLQGKRLP